MRACVTLLIVMLSGTVAADEVVVFPVTGSGSDDENFRQAAAGAAVSALRSSGHEPRVFDGESQCTDPDCARALIGGEDGAVLGMLVNSFNAESPYEVHVTLFDVAGRREGNGRGHGEILTQAVAGGVAIALRDLHAIDTSRTVTFSGSPRGASVMIGGQVIGTLPVTAEIPGDATTVRVSFHGYETAERDLGDEESLTFHLLRSEEGNGDPPTERGPRSIGTWLLGGALALGGGLVLAPALRALFNDGDCERMDMAGRCRRYHFGGRSKTLLAVGAALVVAGIVIAAWGPFRTEVRASQDGASAHLHLEF